MQRDLVEKAMDGDHEAFSELARHAVDRMYSVARLILRDNVRAEDATQEALVAAWRTIHSLRDPERFDAWLRRILLNECYREARREKARFRHEAYVEAINPENPFDAINDLANRDQLERGFAHLKPDQRALLVLHFYVGLPLAEQPMPWAFPLARSSHACTGRPSCFGRHLKPMHGQHMRSKGDRHEHRTQPRTTTHRLAGLDRTAARA